MPELNKFLDLEGLKVFWDQINEKKQNRTIWYNGKQILIEDCLNDLKVEIEKVQEEIGNIEELDQINEHISKIQSTLQEIDDQLNNLEENYVPESRTVAGINLTNNIQASTLKNALGINKIENTLNGNIKNDNLSKVEFFERGNVYATSLQDNSYYLKGSYCIFSDMCILSAEITMKNGEQYMTYNLPVPTHSQEYAMIYAPDRTKNVCEISVNRDGNSAVLHVQKPNRDSGSTLTETETHFTIIYKI